MYHVCSDLLSRTSSLKGSAVPIICDHEHKAVSQLLTWLFQVRWSFMPLQRQVLGMEMIQPGALLCFELQWVQCPAGRISAESSYILYPTDLCCVSLQLSAVHRHPAAHRLCVLQTNNFTDAHLKMVNVAPRSRCLSELWRTYHAWHACQVMSVLRRRKMGEIIKIIIIVIGSQASQWGLLLKWKI